ncbi:hypothetical protein J2Y69_000724 [Microbacterium resistens]|uniref:Uncharacterized protein n=1 Tax=Microbacterium resistens TaxID=156977 RepID=A0ABU1S972_9MICO|nr:hypothetical protein [Microbacterium resistens]MDR6866139.1 hypothetical protein [Microbacterium resistens]
MADGTAAIDDVLGGGHRTIRRVTTDEGPYEGRLVSHGDEVCVAVDTAALEGWAGWRIGDAMHVAAPLDLVRTTDGQEVLLPWCTETVPVFVARRDGTGPPLSAGERTTLIASLLRGVVEAGDIELMGGWWLTVTGRPVFVMGDGEAIARASAEIVRTLGEQTTDRSAARLCERIRGVLGDPRRTRHEAPALEAALCELAAPKPLRCEPVGQREPDPVMAISTTRAAATVTERERERRRRDAGSGVETGVGEAAGIGLRRRRLVGGDIDRRSRVAASRAEGSLLTSAWAMVRRVVRGESVHMPGQTGVGRRGSQMTESSRRARPSNDRARRDGLGRDGGGRSVSEVSVGRRRWARPALVGAVVAVAVAIGGASWPASSTDDVGSSPMPSVPAKTPTEGPTGAPTEAPAKAPAKAPAEGPTEAPADGSVEAPSADIVTPQRTPLDAVPELLRFAGLCEGGDEGACARAWVPGSDRARRGPFDAGTAASPTLIEDYGDLAAIRVERGRGPAMLVLARTDDGWRIRDVYDVADPPSGEAR